ncbi:MAG: hypothetical protein LBL46_03790 [Rickettsiales bacterium]|nr:hypothetical protein [Rickettsiales bacterium]
MKKIIAITALALLAGGGASEAAKLCKKNSIAWRSSNVDAAKVEWSINGAAWAGEVAGMPYSQDVPPTGKGYAGISGAVAEPCDCWCRTKMPVESGWIKIAGFMAQCYACAMLCSIVDDVNPAAAASLFGNNL